MLMNRIPIYQPSLAGKEREYVADCLESNWISSKGRYIGLFEDAFARYVNVRNAASVTNGTTALHLALVALGLGPGDEVIVPTLTYIASVNAISYTGATPVFVDSLTDGWQLDPADVERKLSPRTKAIMAVHLYGHPCDMRTIVELAKKNRLFVVEDCAEAIGSRCGDGHVGTFGDIGVFSFYGNKTITTGEGGMVVTNDETLHARMVHFKGQGLAAHRQYWHDVIGYNYRMTNICAAIGLAQMEQVVEFTARKRAIAMRYRANLSHPGITLHGELPGFTNSYWMCSILVDDPSLRDPLRAHLESAGVETRPTFYPVHTMPMYAGKYERHPVAESIGWRGINLPSWPGLTDAQVDQISESVLQFLAKHKG
jgi:perosamine synthetase